MRLVNIREFETKRRNRVLHDLLEERTPEQSISHTKMPSYSEHCDFVGNHPYSIWYFICAEENYDVIYGSLYLTTNREIGIQVFERYVGTGVGSLAMKELLLIHKGPFMANINPANERSIKFFERQGFKHIQNTYQL